MERIHPRDIQLPTAHAAAMASLARTTATTTTASSANNLNLLRRGVRIARSMLVEPRCIHNDEMNTCEKPALSTDSSLGIMAVFGVVAVLIVLGVLFMLHLRRNRRDEAEMANDHHELSDYGLGDIPIKKGGSGAYPQQPAPVQQHYPSGQNRFGAGSEMSDGNNAAPRRGNPPAYPGAVKM